MGYSEWYGCFVLHGRDWQDKKPVKKSQIEGGSWHSATQRQRVPVESWGYPGIWMYGCGSHGASQHHGLGRSIVSDNGDYGQSDWGHAIPRV